MFNFLLTWAVATCPAMMVPTGMSSCIDVCTWPGTCDRNVFGLSAVHENYVPLPEGLWDAESLCGSVGKRVCERAEWAASCEGTPLDACNVRREWRVVDWDRVAFREPAVMSLLDQGVTGYEMQACRSDVGAHHMLGNALEWVRDGDGYALVGGYWSREMSCGDAIRGHSPNWHDYSSTVRCCL